MICRMLLLVLNGIAFAADFTCVDSKTSTNTVLSYAESLYLMTKIEGGVEARPMGSIQWKADQGRFGTGLDEGDKIRSGFTFINKGKEVTLVTGEGAYFEMSKLSCVDPSSRKPITSAAMGKDFGCTAAGPEMVSISVQGQKLLYSKGSAKPQEFSQVARGASHGIFKSSEEALIFWFDASGFAFTVGNSIDFKECRAPKAEEIPEWLTSGGDEDTSEAAAAFTSAPVAPQKK